MTNTTSSDFVTATSLELRLKRETLYLTKAFRIHFVTCDVKTNFMLWMKSL